MTKRLIEFNCGDPKSNQQTASKVDCQITINNNQTHDEKKATDTPEKHPSERRKSTTSRNIKITDGIEVFESESSENKGEDLTSIENASSCEFNTRVSVPVKAKVRSIPTSTERFVMVSRQPIVTTEEIENNVEFQKKLIEILTKTLCMDDKRLLANLIDTSGKIIVSGQDFCELVALMLSTEDYQVRPSDINLTLQEEYISTCLKVQVSPFKAITSIKINNQDFYNVQNEAYNALSDIYKISLRCVYVVPLSKPDSVK